MKALLKSHGILVWNYANGIDDSEVVLNSDIIQKGIGNSTTTKYDVENKKEAFNVLLALTEKVAMRLRKSGCLASLVSISLKTDGFIRYSHQVQLQHFICSTSEIFGYVCRLFNECWQGEPLRHLGVSVSGFKRQNEPIQLSIFDGDGEEVNRKLDIAVDKIRETYGDKMIIRGVFANTDYKPIQGGTHDGEYIMMGGYQG